MMSNTNAWTNFVIKGCKVCAEIKSQKIFIHHENTLSLGVVRINLTWNTAALTLQELASNTTSWTRPVIKACKMVIGINSQKRFTVHENTLSLGGFRKILTWNTARALTLLQLASNMTSWTSFAIMPTRCSLKSTPPKFIHHEIIPCP